jgi:hypothetical protein
MLLSASHGFLLDGERAREEKGDMTFLRPLHVVASFGLLAVLASACTAEEDESSLSGSQSASQSASASESSGGGSSSGGSSAGTTEAPASSSGEVSTSDSPTTNPTTTADPTTGSGTTTGDATTSGGGTTTGNQAACGDGVINGNEQCDGANLNGFTCEALGNAGGTLLCDAVTCTFDTQMCDVGGSGGTSG